MRGIEEVSIFAPLKNERHSVSAEGLLDKQKQNTLKRSRRKKLQNFLQKKLPVKKEFVFLQSQLEGAQE
ncbi:hypothetical protein EG352_20580 [Chryseobacterium indologenes]|uniref:Uncharacterized protein n=1 Tax=Chryseobacterium indologenes TaxID=253 RepID=A0AAD0YZN4_CHRID|nr:hypothetical protein EG352_20580 [Chryseobacterium indologenes]